MHVFVSHAHFLIIPLSDDVDKALSPEDPHMKKKGFLVYSLRNVILFVVFGLDSNFQD